MDVSPLGASRLNITHFTWNQSGDLVRFSAWAPDEPSRSSESCVVLTYGWGDGPWEWHDVDCSMDVPVLCEL